MPQDLDSRKYTYIYNLDYTMFCQYEYNSR